ncbi:MAG: hypothetical protein HZB29_02950 [Nitrospinae bacterium]|nr:hypothetical protein [Nitrospinota bacterium]
MKQINPALTGRISPRTPFIILAAWIIYLFAAYPFSAVNADVADFGILGDDLIKYGYLPTFPYGQDYLFSLTPYLYALLRLALPATVSSAIVIKGAGAVFLLAGLFMMSEAIAVTERSEGRDPVFRSAVFCAFVAVFPTHLFTINEMASLEMSFFTLGAIILAGAKIEPAIGGNGVAGLRFPLMFGGALGFAMISRPQAAVYGFCALSVLVAKTWRKAGARSVALLAAPIVAAAAAGWTPVILHKIFRAHKWPFTLKTGIHISSMSELHDRIELFYRKIIPSMFDLGPDQPVFSALAALGALLALGWFFAAAFKDRRISAADFQFVAGSAIIVAVMLAIPGMSASTGHRRYILHAFTGTAWLFASWACMGLWRKRGAALLLAAIAVLSIPMWRERLDGEKERNMNFIDTAAMVPGLAAHGYIFIADYWDAYLLVFISGGKVKAEPLPWQLVRRYGAIPEKEMAENSVWIIPEGLGGEVHEKLASNFGRPDAIREMYITLFGKRRVMTWFDDGSMAAKMMRRENPLYFPTRYPPGS